MKEVLQFAILGLGVASIYALLGSGIVLIYRGSGVVNFAHGAIALVGAVVYTELHKSGVTPAVAVFAATTAGALLGPLIQLGIMRRLRDASPLAKLIATLGILIVIQSLASLHYKSSVVAVTQYLPVHPWHIFGLLVQSDRLILFGIAVLITVLLAVGQKRWTIGLATRAAAENDMAASTLGWSPEVLATINWTIGAAFAGLAGALIVPLAGLSVNGMVLLVLPALAAALLGGFNSFFLTLAGATLIGIGQALITRYVTQTGAGEAFPFIVIIVVMILTGRALPLRSEISERLPSLGSGAVRKVPVAVAFVVGALLMGFVFNVEWLEAFTVSLSLAVVLLSIVVLTGYAGQISLMQYAFAGLGAYIAGRLVATTDISFWLAFLIGVVAAVPIGVVFALPALRTRGVNLAVVTLGLGVAVVALLFSNVSYTGGFQGTQVGSAKLFGLDIGAVNHPERYGVFVLVLFTVAALAVANLRRSPWGRRLIAIRENERAATSLGVSVTGAKLYAFTVAAAIASLGGILIGFRSNSIIFTTFSPLQSIYAVVFVVIGGLGFIAGPLIGSLLVAGGVGTLLSNLIPSINEYLPLIGGVFVLLTLMMYPDGAAPGNVRAIKGILESRPLSGLVARTKRSRRSRPGRLPAMETQEPERVPARTMEVRDLSVRFGAVTAVNGVSIDVKPGEVIGLIGPNGAGKTTFIDAVSGFVPTSSGTISLDGEVISNRSAQKRVSMGIARSWQSLELFEDVSVIENLLVASESTTHSWTQSFTALVRPGKPRLGAAAAAAVAEFELDDDLDRRPGDLPHGRQRLVGLARAVALSPSVLMLDEPAAGLGSIESQELGKLLRRLADGWDMGILLVEHDVDLVMSVCDRIVVLNFGEIIAQGAPEEIRTDPQVIEAYLGSATSDQDAAADQVIL